MHQETRKYQFDWDLVNANCPDSRPGLGNTLRMEIYRLFQLTMRDVLEQRYSTEEADAIFRDAGVLAGKEFYDHFCNDASDIGQLAKVLQEQCRELGIGIMRFERIEDGATELQMTVDEDLDCSGMPDTHEQVCVYDEGFIKGILERFTGKSYTVREVDCWCTGERTCRFKAVMNDVKSSNVEKKTGEQPGCS